MKKYILTGILGALVIWFCITLVSTIWEINLTQIKIQSIEGDLNPVKSEAATVETQLATITSDLESTKTELSATRIKVSSINTEISTTKAELSTSKTLNVKLNSGDKYNLRAVTYQEVMNFIAADQTNNKRYATGVYTVSHASRDVVNAAKDKGLRCALAMIIFSDGMEYPLAAFQTSDTGLVYINTRTDRVMTVSIGGHLWKDNGSTSTYDDTIKDILIFW